MKKLEIIYHLKEGRQISQISKITRKKFEEIMKSDLFNRAKFIAISKEGLYIPISSILYIEVEEIKNGNN